MARAVWAWVCVLSVLGHARVVGAQSSSVVEAPPQCGRGGAGSALARAARCIGEGLGPLDAAASVVSAPLQSDIPAPRASALTARVAELVAGALGSRAHALGAAMTLAAARAQAAGVGLSRVVYLEPRVEGGQLKVSASVYPLPRNLWDRCANPSPGPVSHTFVASRLDAEIRSYLAPVPLVAQTEVRAPLLDPETLALACDDVDGDESVEMVLVSRRDVRLARVRDRQLVTVQETGWDALSPIAPAPWREPLATIAVRGPSVIDVAVTDRARGVRLDGTLRLVRTLTGMPVALGDLDSCAQPGPGVLQGPVSSCAADATQWQIQGLPVAFDVVLDAIVVQADGTMRSVTAARDASDGTLRVWDAQGRAAVLRDTGAQVVVADLDFDGVPEIVSSRNVWDPAQDALVWRSWGADGTMRQRKRIAVPHGVRALAVCPPDGPGARALALATSSELWLIR